MKTKKITLEQAIVQIENYVPTSIPAEKFAPVRPYVIETMKTVATYAGEHPKVYPLTSRVITDHIGALATHCVTVKDSHGDLPSEDELFNGELITWSVTQLPLSDSTRAIRARYLRKIGAILKEVHAPAIPENPVQITSTPYTRAELHEIIRTVRAQSTHARSDNGTVIVALGLSGMLLDDVREVRVKHVDYGPPVTVRVKDRAHIIPTVLSDEFLEVVEKRDFDEYLVAPGRARNGHTVSEALRDFSYGHACPPITLKRLNATWSENLFKRGISQKAFASLTGSAYGSFDKRQRSFPVDADAVLETAGLLTDLMIVGMGEIEQVITGDIEPFETGEMEPFTVIEGGKTL